MLRINENTITVVRKDTGSISFSVDNYKLTTGDKVYFTVATEPGLQTPLFQKVVTSFSDLGVADIDITSTDTDLEPDTYYYDIQVNRADGQVDTVIGPAKFKVIEGVTF